MFYPPFGTKQVEIFLFIKRKSAILINIFTNGMYLWGLPRINDIQSVNITYPSVTDDVKEISSSEDIELALKLTGFLKYDLWFARFSPA